MIIFAMLFGKINKEMQKIDFLVILPIDPRTSNSSDNKPLPPYLFLNTELEVLFSFFYLIIISYNDILLIKN